MAILAIDPGNIESAYVLVDNDLSRVIDKGKVLNEDLKRKLEIDWCCSCAIPPINYIAIEMIASYGMAVGKSVFDTCVWIGRFYQIGMDHYGVEPTLIYRSEEKMCLCGNMKAKDSNIRQALIDRFGEVGTKKNPGFFYGFKKDIWAAMSVCVAFHDKYLDEQTKFFL